jgi:hypothetical protein
MKEILFVSAVSLTVATFAAARPAFAQDAAEPPPPPPPSAAPVLVPIAQTEGVRAPNSVYAEGLGAGLLYSINYERLVTEDIGVRAGFGYWSVSSSASSGGTTATSSASALTIPITVSYLGVRGRKSALEVGGGLTVLHLSGQSSGFGVSSNGSDTTALGVAMIGYRLHPVEGAGFQFRVGGMVLGAKGLGFSSTNPDSFGFLPWLYLSLGASF